ncbi:MAG: hypothetical protein R3F39_03650 [Myxococcota bacterium]
MRKPCSLRTLLPLLVATALSALLLTGCDSSDDVAVTQAGTVTLRAEEGVDFATGQILRPGNYLNSDLYVTANAPSFRMSPGGPSPTKVRDTSWIKTGGGVLVAFDSLADVPETLPTPGAGSPLPSAKVHIGFVIEDMRGGFAKGWVQELTSDTITVQYAPIAVSTR